MAASLVNFFQKHLAGHADDVDEHIKARRARLSAAALLVEVMNADGHYSAEERKALFLSVQSQFSLTGGEAKDLLVFAEQQARDATDLYEFTAAINKHYDLEQKIALIQEMWRAAYADEVLHRYEEQLVRKVGNLLYVPHASVLLAMQRAQAAVDKSK